MSRAARKTKRRKNKVPATAIDQALAVPDFIRGRLISPDPRSQTEFLNDMRAKQAAERLVNPATAALLDRLERAI